MLYSPSTNGFYTTEMHGENIPGDAVVISPAEHAELLTEQGRGKRIRPGAGGRPEAAVVDVSPADCRVARREAILDAWPVHDQLEAITEAEVGRPEKLARLIEDIAKVKQRFPKPETTEAAE